MSKDTRTYADRAEYIKLAVQKRREKIRRMAVEYKGSLCQICRYSRCIRAFDFHHVDPLEKDFGISEKGYTRSWDRVKVELDKCVMLCANCHREVHDGVSQLPAETLE